MFSDSIHTISIVLTLILDINKVILTVDSNINYRTIHINQRIINTALQTCVEMSSAMIWYTPSMINVNYHLLFGYYIIEIKNLISNFIIVNKQNRHTKNTYTWPLNLLPWYRHFHIYKKKVSGKTSFICLMFSKCEYIVTLIYNWARKQRCFKEYRVIGPIFIHDIFILRELPYVY